MGGTYTQRGLIIAETVFQQLLAVFVLLVLWEVFKNYNFDNVHAWHVVLCTIGCGLCMAEGLMLYNRENTFLREMERLNRNTVHGAVMFIAFVCITIGISLKINQKSGYAVPDHFKSTHAILGLVAWILSFFSIVLGVVVGNISRFSSIRKPALWKIIHLFLGVSAYIIAVVALGYGLDYLVGLTGSHGRIALIVFLSLYVAYSLIGPVKSCYNYFLV